MSSSASDRHAQAQQLEQYVSKQISRTTAQVRWVEIATSFILVFAVSFAAVLAFCVVDAWVVSFSPVFRLLFLLALVIGGVGFFLWQTFPLLIHKINPVYAAQMIERSSPGLKNSLLNYLTLRDARISKSVKQMLQNRAVNDLSKTPVENSIDRSSLIRIGFVIVGLFALAIGYKLFSPKDPFHSVARLAAPLSKIASPSRVRIVSVEPGDVEVFFGDSVDINVSVKGLAENDSPVLVYSSIDGEVVDAIIPFDQDERTRGLRTRDFTCRLSATENGIQRNVNYRIVAGDAKSEQYQVIVSPKPTLTVSSIILTPPDYTELQQVNLGRKTDIRGIEGTKVEVAALANVPIRGASIELLNRSSNQGAESEEYTRVAALPLDISDQQATGEFVLRMNTERSQPAFTHYRLTLVSKEGKVSTNESVYTVEVQPDLGPEVEVVSPVARESELPANQAMPILIRANDPDFKISWIELTIVHRGQQKMKTRLPLDRPESLGSVQGQYKFQPDQLGLKAGDNVVFFAKAADNRTSPGNQLPDPNIASTQNYQVKVLPLEKKAGDAGDQTEDKSNDNENGNPDEKNSRSQDKDNQNSGDEKSPPSDSQSQSDSNSEEKDNGTNSDSKNESGDSTKDKGESKQGNSDENKGDENKGDENKGDENKGDENKGDENNGDDKQGDGNKGQGQQDGKNGTEQKDGNQTGDSDSGQSSSDESGGDKSDSQKQDGGEKNQQSESTDSGSSTNRGDDQNDSNSEKQGGDDSASSSSSGSNGQKQGDDSRQQNSGNQMTEKGDRGEQSSDGKGGNQQDQPGNSDTQPGKGTEDSSNPNQNQRNEVGENGQKTDPQESTASENGSSNNGSSDSESPDSKPLDKDAHDGDVFEKIDKRRRAEEEKNRRDNDGQKKSQQADDKNADPNGTSGNKQDQESGDERKSTGDSGKGDNKNRDNQDGKPGRTGENATQSDEKKIDDGNSGSDNKPGEQKNLDKPKNAGDQQDNQQKDDLGQAKSDQSATDQKESEAGDSGTGEKPDENSSTKQPSDSDPSKSKGNGSSQDKPSTEKSDQKSDQKSSKGKGDSRSDSKGGERANDQPTGKSENDNSRNNEPSADDRQSQNPRNGNQENDRPSSSGNQTAGGSPGTGPNQQQSLIDEDLAPEEKENLKHAKEVTDLALEYLENQKNDPDQQLLDELNWSREDLNRFVDRWKKMKDKAKTGSIDDKKTLERNLRSLGLRSSNARSVVDKVKADNVTGLNEDGSVSRPPPEFAREFLELQRKRAKSNQR